MRPARVEGVAEGEEPPERLAPERVAEIAGRRAGLARVCADLLRDRSPGEAIVLEVGCGHGHFLTAYAAAHPERFCLGIDLVSKRVACSQRKQAREGRDNLRFLKAEAGELLDALPPDTRLHAIFLLFPDPWPKRRHHRRRIIDERFVERIAARTGPGGRLHLRTDHAGAHAAARRLLEASGAFVVLPDQPWPFEHETLFQKRLPVFHDLIVERRREP